MPDLPHLNRAAGDNAVAVFDRLRLADVPGTPPMAEAGGDWFRDIVRAMFGSWHHAAQVRFIVELFLLVPKKNSKTTNGALFMLTALLLNLRPRAPFALMAPVQDTAEEAFEAAAGAIALDDVLGKLFHVRNHLKTIVHRETKADLKIMTFDPDVLTGKKFVGTLLDEVHVIAKNAKAAKAIRQVRGGMMPFPEAFLAMITTMPDDEPVGVMKAELKKARDVRDGKTVAPLLPVLYELPRKVQQDKSWRNPELWPMVTPNLNRSVTMARLQAGFEDAVLKGDAELRGWASQHLNVEIGLALTTDCWAGAEFWEAAEIEGIKDLGVLLARCDVATVGVDGGGLDDLLGLVIMGRERETGRWLLWAKAWAHRIVLTRRQEIAQQLLDLEEAEQLTICDKPGQDVDELAALVKQAWDAGLLEREEGEQPAAIGVDPVGIGAVMEALNAAGIPREKVIGIQQGWKMTGAVKETERRLAAGTLVHGGGRLMAWSVANAKIEPRANGILITKQASGTAKVDPVLAMVDAVSLMMLNPASQGRSFWERPKLVAAAA